MPLTVLIISTATTIKILCTFNVVLCSATTATTTTGNTTTAATTAATAATTVANATTTAGTTSTICLFATTTDGLAGQKKTRTPTRPLPGTTTGRFRGATRAPRSRALPVRLPVRAPHQELPRRRGHDARRVL